MYCVHCGAQNPDDAAFCHKCGKPTVTPAVATGQGAEHVDKVPRKLPWWVWLGVGLVIFALVDLIGFIFIVAPRTGSPLAFSKPSVTPTPVASFTPTTAFTPTSTPTATPIPVISVENAANLEQIAVLGKGWIHDIAFSPDGDLLAVATMLGTYLYDPSTLEIERFIPGKQDWSLSFNKDGSLLAVVGANKTVNVYSVESGELYKEIPVENSPWSVTFSPTHANLLAIGEYGQACIWDINTVKTANCTDDFSYFIMDMVFSPDGKALAMISDHTPVYLWYWQAIGQPLQNLTSTFDLYFSTIAFSSQFTPEDGYQLAFGALDGSLLRMQKKNYDEPSSVLNNYESIDTSIYDLVFTAEVNAIYTASDDGVIRKWNTTSGNRTFDSEIGRHNDRINGLSYSPTHNLLASYSGDGELKIWNLVDGTSQSIDGHIPAISDLDFSPAGDEIAFSLNSRTQFNLHLWKWNSGDDIRILEGTQGAYLDALDFAPDGGKIVAAAENDLEVWDAATGELLDVLKGSSGWVGDVSFSLDGRNIASVSRGGSVMIWRAADGHEIFSYDYDGSTNAVTPSFDEKFWYFGLDRTLMVMDNEETGSPDGIYYFENPISVLASSPQNIIAVGDSNDQIHLYDTANAQVLRTIPAGQIDGMAFSPDGSLLAVAGSDYKLRVFDVQTGDLLSVLEEHKFSLTGVAFSPNGSYLASSGYDGTIRVWAVK